MWNHIWKTITRRIFYSLLLSGSPIIVFAQNHSFIQDSILGARYQHLADSLYAETHACINYSHLALPLLKKTKQWDKYIYCLNGLRYCYLSKEDLDSARIVAEFAFEEGGKYLDKSDADYIGSISNLGSYHYEVKEDYGAAYSYYKQALEMVEDVEPPNQLLMGQLYNNIGATFRKRGDFDAAKPFYQKALSLYSSVLPPNHTYLAILKNNLSQFYVNHKDLSAAKQALNEALKILANNNEAEQKYFIEFNTSLAKIYEKEDDLNSALDYLEIASSSSGAILALDADIQNAYGSINFKQGDYDKAIVYFDKAIELIPSSNDINLASTYTQLGKSHEALKEFEKSLTYYDKAISHLIRNYQSEPLFDILDESDLIISKIELFHTLSAKAQTQKEYYQHSKNKIHLITALATYQLLSKLSDQIREDYRSETSKIFLAGESSEFYENAIEAAFQLYQLTQEEKYLHECFFFAEKSKGVVLLDEIKLKENAGQSQIPDTILTQAYQLRVDINYFQKLVDLEEKKTMPDKNKITDWQSQIFALKQAQQTQKEAIQKDHPDYYRLTDNQPISIAEVQKSLQSEEAMVAYFAGKEKIFAIKIQSTTIDIFAFQNDFGLDSLVTELLDLRKMPSKSGFTDFAAKSYNLYQKLLAPLKLSAGQALTIIPDGILAYLPFEMLLTEAADEQHPSSLAYLLHRHCVSYGYSATILAIQQKIPTAPLSALKIAPVFEGTPRYLKYSKTEIDFLESIGGKSLVGKAATTEEFLQIASDFGLLHFSTHATAADSLRRQPTIEFYDAPLYLSDLYTLRLHAQLAVLSACETALGDQRKGEGIISLSRGFTYAGVPSVTTSLWAVNEQATSLIIQHFYENLKNGDSKKFALQKAKQHFLKNCRTFETSPYYWAGIISTGNQYPVKFETANNSLIWWILGTILIIVLSYSVTRKNSKT